MAASSGESEVLVGRAAAGDRAAWDILLHRHHARLRKLVALRLDVRLHGRIDPSDVIQEAYIDAARRIDEHAAQREVSFYLWLRFLVGQKLIDLHRRHLGAQARDAAREISLYRGAMPEATTAALAAQLLGKHTSPSQALLRAERKIRLQEALNAMDPVDREVLVLRHYEQLSNSEAAQVLGLDKSAASKRYARALVRLKDVLAAMPGGLDEG